MDSSPVLRQQSQKKVHSDFQRMKNEHNKMPLHQKSSKPLPTSHFANKDVENKEPGVSRLPVLAKSLRLPTPSDFSRSHCRWEEKSLAGKAKTKKPCTRPVPFNLTQPKSSRMASENQQPRTGSHAVQSGNNLWPVRLKNSKMNAKHPSALNSNMDSFKASTKFNGTTAEKPHSLSGQSRTSNTFKTSSHPLSSVPQNTKHPNKDAASSSSSSSCVAFNAETCLDNMNLLSLNDPTKTSHTSQNTQLTAQSTKVSADKQENFQTDHKALLSILRNEGVSGTSLGAATPQSKPYNYVPQRVSILKSRHKAGPTAGPVKSVHFSPDSAALQSILHNEGVKAGDLIGATPQNAVRPSGRGTSIYTAQRVPARKNRAEAAGGAVSVALKETPLKKWTPQRVLNTKHQPMSAMKWHLQTQQSPYTSSPGLRSYKTNLQPQQEEIVQRLFDDQEEEQNTNVMPKHPEIQAETPQSTTAESHSEEKEELTSRTAGDDEDEKQSPVRGPPFIQAPQRESVIFFSTGKKLLRAPRFEQKETLVHPEQHSLHSSEEGTALPVHEETSPVSESACGIDPLVQSLHRDPVVPKTSALSSAAALLRKRLPPLEELRMDEEVATYTSMSATQAPATPGFLPPRPRCGNPLAAILHFEECSRFVPIGCSPCTDWASPLSSPLQER